MRKHWRYLSYIIRHKWFVFVECFKERIPWRGLMHDMSKFRPSEWFAYADYFYGGPYPETDTTPLLLRYMFSMRTQAQCQADFDHAWLLHQHRNPHHWQFWLLHEDTRRTVEHMIGYEEDEERT